MQVAEHHRKVPKTDVSRQALDQDLASALDTAIPKEVAESMTARMKFDAFLSLVNGGRRFDRSVLDTPSPDYAHFTSWLRDVVNDPSAPLAEGEAPLDYQRLYKGYLAEQANWELLKRFLITTKKLSPEVVDPEAEQASELDLDAIPVATLEDYYRPLASGKNRPMRYVGFHTSDKAFPGDIQPGQSTEMYANAIKGVPETGWTFYSLDPEHLVHGKWMYLVEVSRNDVKEAIRQTEQKEITSSVYTPGNEWVGSRSPLHVIERVAVSPELIAAYGLKFVK